jgi:hypothetical protein
MNPNETAPPAADAQTPAAATPAITAETIAAAVTAGLQAHETRQSAPKEMTPEEKAEYLQIFDPNEDGFLDSFVSAITSEDATPEIRLKAIEHLRDGIANQAIRGAQLIGQNIKNEILQEFAPIRSRVQQDQAEELWSNFSKAHPDLKDHRNIVDMVSNQLQASGFTPKSLDEAFSRAAETTRQVIAQTTGKPYTPPAANPTEPQKPRMSSTNVVASAGTGTPAASETGVASFFLKRKR